MASYKQSTAYTRTFLMVLTSDHLTAATGKTVTVNIAKAGGAFGAAAGTITEMSNGWYKIVLTTADTGTLGDLSYNCTAAACDNTDFVDQVTVRDIADLAYPATTGRSLLVGTDGSTDANVTKWLGTAASTPTVAGVPNVNVKTWNDLTTVALPLIPTTAGRTLDVSATGEAGLDWANIGAPTTANALTGTTIATTQKVDIETIKTNPVVNAGTVTFPTTATLASTTNITAGTMTTTTNLTNAATAGDLTATMKTSVTTAATAATPTAAAVTGAVGSVTAGVTVTTNNDKTGYGLSAAAVQAIWDALTSALTTVGSIGKKLADWTIGAAQTGDSFARLGAPAGASVSADVAAVKSDTAATLDDTGTSGVAVADKTGYRLSATGVNDILRTVLTEAYAADGAAPTLSELLFLLQAALTEFSITGTTITAKKVDGVTTAATFTLDSSTAPTSRTRAT